MLHRQARVSGGSSPTMPCLPSSTTFDNAEPTRMKPTPACRSPCLLGIIRYSALVLQIILSTFLNVSGDPEMDSNPRPCLVFLISQPMEASCLFLFHRCDQPDAVRGVDRITLR